MRQYDAGDDNATCATKVDITLYHNNVARTVKLIQTAIHRARARVCV